MKCFADFSESKIGEINVTMSSFLDCREFKVLKHIYYLDDDHFVLAAKPFKAVLMCEISKVDDADLLVRSYNNTPM